MVLYIMLVLVHVIVSVQARPYTVQQVADVNALLIGHIYLIQIVDVMHAVYPDIGTVSYHSADNVPQVCTTILQLGNVTPAHLAII